MNCGRLRPYGIQWALSAAGASQVLDTAKAQAGDVLVFRWSGGSSQSFDHVGLCELNRGSYYQTLEFNVSNSVGRRTRAYSTVVAVWRPAYTSASKSNAYIAREVINGQWGMGKERETLLTNAGYSYPKVQSIVNLILGGTVSQLAQMVIAGEFGMGNERKYILGSRYESVQNKVNSLLSK